MKRWLLIVFAAALFVWPAARAGAVVVFPKDREKPVMGFLVSEDARSIAIEEVLPGGRRSRTTFLKSDLTDIIRVSAERLESLDEEKPRHYRDFAEELAERRRDPEARETAIRLYLIAAHLDPDDLGRSSLLGMIDLARGADEEARFRAMAYLLDPEHNARVLSRPKEVNSESYSSDSRSRDRLRLALQLLRRGKKSNARQVLSNPAVQAELQRYPEVLSPDEFKKASLETVLSPSVLRKVLLLELALSPRPGSRPAATVKDDAAPLTWSESVRRDGTGPIPTLTLESLTEFDPRKCHFKAGKWVEP